MRVDSPFVLAGAGTIAIHLVLAVIADALVVTHPPAPPTPPPPHLKLIKIEPLKLRPPPKERTPEPKRDEVKPEPKKQRPTQRVAERVEPARPPEQVTPPQTTTTDPSQSGGDTVLQLPNLDQTTTGVAVRTGKRSEGGGTGGERGTGTGDGRGSGAAPKPMSVATIKTRALPKGDYSYVDIGRDYPAEAKELGIEGAIRVKLTVDDHGKVAAAVLLNKLGHGLDELALDRARKIVFVPAKDTSDQAVASVVIWTFQMTLPKS